MTEPRFRVAVLTEAGPGVGLGHLRRCQALAAELVAGGAVVRLLVAGAPPAPGGPAALPLERLAWTREPGAARTAVAAIAPDALIVDSYQAGPALLAGLRPLAGCLVVIDDLAAAPLVADIVVNGACHAAELPYHGTAATWLLGPEFALLDPAFAAPPPARGAAAGPDRILVALGADSDPVTLEAVLATVRRAVPAASVDLALGPFAASPGADGRAIRVHHGPPSLRPLLSASDLAVTGGGMTLYECLAAGVPVVGLCLADNQRPNLEAMGRAELVVRGEPDLERAIRDLAGDPARRRELGARGRAVVDGRGAGRVAARIVDACRGAGAVRGAP